MIGATDSALEDQQDERYAGSQHHLATPLSLSPVSQNGDTGTPSNGPDLDRAAHADNAHRNAHGLQVEPSTAAPEIESPIPLSADAPRVLKMSPAQIYELTASPDSVPVRMQTEPTSIDALFDTALDPLRSSPTFRRRPRTQDAPGDATLLPVSGLKPRPSLGPRTASSPIALRRNTVSGQRPSRSGADTPGSAKPSLNLKLNNADKGRRDASPRPTIFSRKGGKLSPQLSSLPLPPLSMHTYLHLELSSDRPSPLYIHRLPGQDVPYESSAVKFERLLNFLYLPHQLEQVLLFGTLACLDAWLYNFTILPLRFIKAACLLCQWWAQTLLLEAKDITAFVHAGLGRLWSRQIAAQELRQSPNILQEPTAPRSASRSVSRSVSPDLSLQPIGSTAASLLQQLPRRFDNSGHRHKRTKSQPSVLLPNHKGDILHGLLIIISCMILVRFDASRMYHSIRGQAAIKLYVIYNVLEVGDRLFSALGQDVLECLFSKETLERKPNGRSKVIRPFWMFMLALVYNIIHSTMLFYQVITLNVAVNSYSNALLTLLMSNQFVEIKGTVFKRFEKDNLFQVTCADIVERFQLWLMLLIIALRNIAEVGGLSIGGGAFKVSPLADPNSAANTSTPFQSSSILPNAFTLLPQFTGQVLGPFLIVLGSEMLVDWVKHAYINKFNRIKPTLYGRFLDVLAKDHYSHAFADQNLTKRLGLPVLPLSCLFIRAAVQTYHMFIATHVPEPTTSKSTAVGPIIRESSVATTAALAQIDAVIRRALGRSSFGAGGVGDPMDRSWFWSLDDLIALTTMILFFSILYLFLLAFKLALGIVLLKFARSRYQGMKEREGASHDTDSRRVGRGGVVEMTNETKKWIEADHDAGTGTKKELLDHHGVVAMAKSNEQVSLDTVGRYMMVAKRIW